MAWNCFGSSVKGQIHWNQDSQTHPRDRSDDFSVPTVHSASRTGTFSTLTNVSGARWSN